MWALPKTSSLCGLLPVLWTIYGEWNDGDLTYSPVWVLVWFRYADEIFYDFSLDLTIILFQHIWDCERLATAKPGTLQQQAGRLDLSPKCFHSPFQKGHSTLLINIK